MELEIYDKLPLQAKAIRTAVFMEEQGFENEFDDIDNIATHFVLFDRNVEIATCRVYYDQQKKSYILGRIAVIKVYRKSKIGTQLIKQVEKYLTRLGGEEIMLHGQLQAVPFYQKLGYQEFGEIDYDENCPHIWLKKDLNKIDLQEQR